MIIWVLSVNNGGNGWGDNKTENADVDEFISSVTWVICSEAVGRWREGENDSFPPVTIHIRPVRGI